MSFYRPTETELLNQALKYFHKGDFKQAFDCFDKVITDFGNITLAWLGKGDCLSELGLFEQSIQCYDYVLKTRARESSCFMQCGRSFIKNW